jgi:hypothetical protein
MQFLARQGEETQREWPARKSLQINDLGTDEVFATRTGTWRIRNGEFVIAGLRSGDPLA